MIKTRWVRNAAIFGTAVTLSLASVSVPVNEGSAASFCQETEMAGLSLSLDKFYSVNFANADSLNSVNPTASPLSADAATATAAPSAAPSSESEKEPEEKSEEQRKEETVAKQFRDLGISKVTDYVNIRKKPTTESKILGKLYRGSAAKILGEKSGWVRIESGSVTGYIRKDLLAIGAEAQELAGKFGTAFASVNKGVITLNVRSKKSTESSIVTQIPEDEKYEILGESDNWYRISVDDGTKGYIAKQYSHMRVRFKKAISIAEEKAELRRKREAEEAERQRLAELAAERERASSSSNSSSSSSSSSNSSSSNSSSSNSSSSRNNSSSSRSNSSSSNNSSSNSNSSTYHATPGGSGSAIANYACKFVGRPYVWGGTSLTNGADCSGFTMSVYAQFGYSLPHSSAAQAGCGRSVSLSSLQPGDLIFYRNGSRIGHVAMYIGGGRVVHASNKTDGIKISSYNYRQPACARRIVG
ncbi:MAG: SH3 domain-containing protein [Lachnospiraceae bacterium]|jgi:cell wall-associated NlpC family hydrolase|nr:SH3 domain-containing protein [Lachnospiraceae bacterium]